MIARPNEWETKVGIGKKKTKTHQTEMRLHTASLKTVNRRHKNDGRQIKKSERKSNRTNTHATNTNYKTIMKKCIWVSIEMEKQTTRKIRMNSTFRLTLYIIITNSQTPTAILRVKKKTPEEIKQKKKSGERLKCGKAQRGKEEKEKETSKKERERQREK